MAWNFARYVGRVVEAGKAEYPIPMYTNCPQYGIWEGDPQRGQSGGPMPDAMDVWRAGAPRIDLFAADIYGPDFVALCAKYTQSGNPLFIAETGGGREAKPGRSTPSDATTRSASRRSGLTGWRVPTPDLTSGYDLISQLAPLILEHQGNGTMSAVLLSPNDPPQKIQVGNYTLEVAFRPDPEACPERNHRRQPLPSAALFIATGPDEYYAARQRRNRHLFSQHTGAPARRAGHRGRRHFCRRPLGSRPLARRG